MKTLTFTIGMYVHTILAGNQPGPLVAEAARIAQAPEKIYVDQCTERTRKAFSPSQPLYCAYVVSRKPETDR